MHEITTGVRDLELLAPIIGPARASRLRDAARLTDAALSRRAVVHVNSTKAGGGVAEMLHSLVPYARSVGIDARWLVMDAPPPFFTITKRLHNMLHGEPGDGLGLSADNRDLYDQVTRVEFGELQAQLRPRDLVVLHDPQALGLASMLASAGAHVIWRCHIGTDRDSATRERAWSFLARYLDAVTAVVVSRAEFAPPGVPIEKVHVIAPAIDPLAVKNAPLTKAQCAALLDHAGLVRAPSSGPTAYQRSDGTPGRLDRRADIVQLGPAPHWRDPLVVQVSRWDRLKDMGGVLRAFANLDGRIGSAHLLLAGPNVSGVSDDPEGAAVFGECVRQWREVPHGQRSRIHLACLPTADVDENAVLVNALQRHATVVTQKSLEEGFGLTVAEAMWKGTPVVASAVGGLRDQVEDGRTGFLVEDPHDATTFGARIERLLRDAQLRDRMGQQAQEFAADHLIDRQLVAWGQLLCHVVQSDAQPMVTTPGGSVDKVQ